MNRLPTITLPLLSSLTLSYSIAVAQPDLPTASVTKQPIDVEHRLDGMVEAINEATLTAEISGRVAEVMFDVGDVVPAEAVVIRLRGTEQKAEVARAEAQVQDAKARVVETSRNYRRIESLYEENAASSQALEQAKALMEVSNAALQVAEATLTKAIEQAGYAEIRAPYGGVVTKRHVDQGESVRPGQPLISGFLPDELRVGVEVPQRLIHSVRKRGIARIYLPGREDKPIEVAEFSIFPYASRGVGTTRVRLTLPVGVEDLSPGMLVKVSFVLGTRPVLVIPEQAVVYRSEVIGVYVVDTSGVVSLRRIRTGRKLPGNKLVVLSGLEEGEQVVLEPVKAVAHLKQRSNQ
ncbi:MAG: efflux RND transporter periplasmic adaptor subunit [Arenicellales bacterium]|nr:efflux RND transporter periplasmic adaptor subunit [Arenicellales bacterium]